MSNHCIEDLKEISTFNSQCEELTESAKPLGHNAFPAGNAAIFHTSSSSTLKAIEKLYMLALMKKYKEKI